MIHQSQLSPFLRGLSVVPVHPYQEKSYNAGRVSIVGDSRSPSPLRLARFVTAVKGSFEGTDVRVTVEGSSLPSYDGDIHNYPYRDSFKVSLQSAITCWWWIDLHWDLVKKCGPAGRHRDEPAKFRLHAETLRASRMQFIPEAVPGIFSKEKMSWPQFRGAISVFEDLLTRGPLQMRCEEADPPRITLTIPDNGPVDEAVWNEIKVDQQGNYRGGYFKGCC